MPLILLTWEMGGGQGHLQRLRAIGRTLVARGNQVVAAVPEPAQAGAVFFDTGVRVVAGPGPTEDFVPFPNSSSYSQLLQNAFRTPGQLRGLLRGWRTLWEEFRPSLVVCDFSPTALLALRGLGIPRVTVGTGFCAPPVRDLLPVIRPWENLDLPALRGHEQELLRWVNEVLTQDGAPRLSRLGEIYSDVSEQVLLTFPETDHFGTRPGRYWGTLPTLADTPPPAFPPGHGPRVFAYLENQGEIPRLLGDLARRGWPTLVVGSGFPSFLKDRLTSPTLHWAQGPVDIKAAAETCDFAVTHAGHGVLTSMLLAGRPMLLLPLHVEQFLLAHRVDRMGAGIVLPPDEEDCGPSLEALAENPDFREAAWAFAERHRDHYRAEALRQLVDRLEELARMPVESSWP